MTVQIKAAVLLLIGVTIAALVYLCWDESERKNKLTADLIGTIAAIAYLFTQNSIGPVILVLAAAAIVSVLIFFKPKSAKEPPLTSEPAQEPEPEHMPVPEPEQEPVSEDTTGAEHFTENPPETSTAEIELELEPLIETKKDVEYDNGVVGAPLKKPKPVQPEPEKGTAAEEIDDYQKYLKDKLSDSSPQRNAGVNLKNSGKIDEAIDKWREALKINPDDYKAYCLLAKTYKELGLLEEATREWEHALKIDPTLAEAHYALGFEYSAGGELEEAIASFDNFVKYASSKEAELVEEVNRMIDYLKGQLG